MKTLLVLSLALGGAFALRMICCDGVCGLSAEPTAADHAPFGQYVEARTASVYGGACHYNGELTTQGRSAALVWRLEGGIHHGVTLAGVSIAAAITAPENLATDAPRRSVVYLDSAAPQAQRAAALHWLRGTHAAALGDVLDVETVKIDFASDGEHFRAKVGDALELCGSALPDRECCKMPYNVWYEPFEALEGRLVAQSSHFAWRETRLADAFERAEHNDAFLGRFGAAPQARSCCSIPARAAASCAPAPAALGEPLDQP